MSDPERERLMRAVEDACTMFCLMPFAPIDLKMLALAEVNTTKAAIAEYDAAHPREVNDER